MHRSKTAIDVTDRAIEQFRKMLSISDTTGSAIRISLSGGCCYSFYGLNTTNGGEEDDILVEKPNLKIYLDPAIFEGFSATAIDYKDDLLIMIGEQRNSFAAGLLINMKGGKP